MAIDLLTVSTTFATLVSLISDFRDKNKEVSVDDHQKFLAWLSENRHDEIKALLEQNQQTDISIKVILNQSYSDLSSRLKDIDKNLARLTSADVLFGGLAKAIYPNNRISEQALNILLQFEKSGSSRVLENKTIPTSSYIFVDKAAPNLVFNEPRFIQDDFLTLIEFGLLKSEIDSFGGKLYIYTRAASELLISMKQI